MKKLFALICIALLGVGTTNAQEAFKHLGASLEVGSTGIGVNLSYPLVSDHLIMTVGYNFPSLTISKEFGLNKGSIDGQMNQAIGKLKQYNKMIADHPEAAAQKGYAPITGVDGLGEKIASVKELNADVDASINFGNFKVMLEYYPSTNNLFHFTAGLLIGSGSWMDVDGKIDQKVWNDAYRPVIKAHDELMAIINSHPELKDQIGTIPNIKEAAKITIYDETFVIDPESGKLDAKIANNKVKPYLGIGFGSSIPTKKRCGFQMEIGAYYQGKPDFESPTKVAYDPSAYSNSMVDDVVEYFEYLSWYPQITFRFTGRIF